MLRPSPIIIPFVVSVIFVGCGVTGPEVDLPYPYVDDGPQETESTGNAGQGAGAPGSGSGSTGSGNTGPGSTGSGSTGSGSTGSGETGATSGSSGSGPSSSTGATTGGGGFCTPDPNDFACVACAKQSCCPEVNACAADDNCTCWVLCLEQTGDVVICGVQCGLPGQALNDLGDCTGNLCQVECGL
jgi:hypothetical protein